jgi:HME family heavy-metal exporter
VLAQVARVAEAAQVKRGDAAVNGQPAVILVVSKQPGADTRRLTVDVTRALADLRASLPADIRLNPDLYQQKTFIDLSIRNVIEALRDGGILVVVVLFLFLLNFRTTFITLTAIPLSIVITGLVFKWAGMSINTMTLGGLAVAIGELVDDAIVDVENIFRRLRENARAAAPKPALRVVYEASSEVRNSIVFSTILVVLVFVPLFALEGMEGRLFTPLGVAYIVSILASLLVSLTVTPVLSFWLLPNADAQAARRLGDPPRRPLSGADPGRGGRGGRDEPGRGRQPRPRLPTAVQRGLRAGQRAPAPGDVA